MMTTIALTGGESTWRRQLSRNGMVLGVWLLLGVLLFWYSTLIPKFGEFQVVSITKNSLPLIYLAIGWGIVTPVLVMLGQRLESSTSHDRAFSQHA